jgi:uncharacterized protein
LSDYFQAHDLHRRFVMPVTPTYPGVYIEELPSSVRTITGVATSITAFIGRALRGPREEPVVINGFGDFERIYGGMWRGSRMGDSVSDFFLNGGAQAIIVRVYQDDPAADAAAKVVSDAANAATDEADAIVTAAQTAADPFINTGSEGQKNAAAAVLAAVKRAKDEGKTPADIKAAATQAGLDAAIDSAPLEFADLTLEAASPGLWGRGLRAWVDDNVSAEVATQLGLTIADLFNLTLRDTGTGEMESYRNVSVRESPRQINKVLKDSRLVRWNETKKPVGEIKDITLTHLEDYVAKKAKLKEEDTPENKNALEAAALLLMDPVSQKEAAVKTAQAALDAGLLDPTKTEDDIKTLRAALVTAKSAAIAAAAAVPSSDGAMLNMGTFLPDGGQADKKGLYALEKADLFNLMVIPPYKAGAVENEDVDSDLITKAAAYCEYRRAFLIVDALSTWTDKAKALTDFADLTKIGTNSANAAIFFPRILKTDVLDDNRINTFCAGGAIAGIFARTDAQRGVWKAPAGFEAGIRGIRGLAVSLTDAENGELNPKGLNCLRTLPAAGPVVWGARTLQGNDQLASQWKYIPIRRLALYIEESLYRGTHWVVFEPNDAPLWAQVRLNVGAFMRDLFDKGAFQGATPQQAYFVKCDADTNPQYDIDRGIINVVVGFAPLKPAEFVIIKIQQIAGEIQV